ncbi:hypothetical protein F5X99DRAFT_399474 [Biscogniauxia marginata]|nr:hypothetical protein F5X99DRAFT_399474 [Biscogniauxia marginata]
MPVTELAFLPSRTPGEVSAPLLSEGTAALEAQDRWCEENFTAGGEGGRAGGKPRWRRESRGAALFRPRGGDRGVVLVTAHWDSPEQHHAWIASDANQEGMGRLLPLVRAEDVVFFHVGGVEMFPDVDGEGKATLGAPVVSVTRVRVRDADKQAFEEGFERDRGGKFDGLAAPYRHRGGWRIEREGEGEEEFVLVGGWESGEKAEAWAEGDGETFGACFEALRPLVVEVDVQTYERIL